MQGSFLACMKREEKLMLSGRRDLIGNVQDVSCMQIPCLRHGDTSDGDTVEINIVKHLSNALSRA